MKRGLWIFAAGLMVRLALIAYLAHVMPAMLTWGTNEPGGIARWIVATHSFSSPFHDAHGPTAWLGPVFPFMVAGAFLLFGIQTQASALAVMVFNAVCAAATGIVVYEIGKKIGSEKSGLFAGWLWVFSPYIAIIPFLLWDTSLSALVMGAAILLTLRLGSGKSESWSSCGAVWGVAALVNPALVMPLPILVLLLSQQGKKWKQVLVLSLCTIGVILPWTVRNYVAFHRIILVRSNGLAEVYFANGGFQTHPLGPSMEYQRLGEGEFTAQANRRAVELIEARPVVFLCDSLERAIWFWVYPTNCWPLPILINAAALAGLIVLFRKSRAPAVLLIAVLAVYPLVYYASQVVSRYRHPIEPVLYGLSGAALSGISRRRKDVPTVRQEPTSFS